MDIKDVKPVTLRALDEPGVTGLATLNLVRFSLDFRSAAITNPAASISIVGCLSRKSMDDLGTNLARMCDRIQATRDLLSRGVLPQMFSAYVPLQPAPITEDLIVVTAHNTKVKLFPGMNVVPLDDDSIDPLDDATTLGRIVVDPFAPPT